MKTCVKHAIAIFFFVTCFIPKEACSWTLAEETVEFIQTSHPPIDAASLLTLTHFTPGQTIEADDLARAQAKLEALGLFKNLSLIKHVAGDRLTITWQVEPYPLLRSIQMTGNTPLLEKKLRRAMSLRVGDPLNPDILTEDAEKIRLAFEKSGYFQTQVTPDVRIHSDHGMDLVFRINRGRTYIFGDIHCDGNTLFSCGKINSIIRDFSHFRPSRLAKGIHALETEYRNRGFPNVAVETKSIHFDEARKTAFVFLSVDEGNPLSLEFKGPTVFRRGKLKHITRLLERPNQASPWQLRLAGKRLEEAYAETGYPNVHITPSAIEVGDQKKVTFTIEQGKRVRIKRILFPGREAFNDRTLKEQLASQKTGFFAPGGFQEERIDEDRKRLESYYHDRGYLLAKIETPIVEKSIFGDSVTITFPIVEGPLFRVNQMQWIGNHFLNTEQLMKISRLTKGMKVRESHFQKAREHVLREYSKHGYLYTTLKIEPSPALSQHDEAILPTVDLDITLDEGIQATLDQVIVLGNFRTKRRAIDRAIRATPNKPVNLPKLIDARAALRNFNTYQGIDLSIIGLREKEEHLTALFKLEERPSITHELHLGYDTDNQFSGKYNFIKHALFGTGQELAFTLEGGQDFSQIALTHRIPNLYGGDFNLSESVYAQYEDTPNFEATSIGAFVQTSRSFLSWLTLNHRLGVESIDLRHINEAALDANRPTRDTTLATLDTTLSIDRRDRFSDPSKGFMSQLSLAYNQDLEKPENSFAVTTTQFVLFQKIWSRLSLWQNIRLDRIWTFDEQAEVPTQKLFYLGGNDTLRGFSEDSIDAAGNTLRVFENTELHLALTHSIKLAGFLDNGSLTEDFDDIHLGSIRTSAGPGLRYFTPVGPMRFDYGFILDRKPGEPKGRFHFSFGFFF